MSELDSSPTDNETVSSEDVQQLAGESQGQHAPSTLERVRAWTQEHPLTVAVGAVAAGAVVTAGALTLGSSEEKQGTTITTTEEVENPDGSREVTVEETFIPEPTEEPEQRTPESSEAEKTNESNAPEDKFDLNYNVEGDNPDEFYEYQEITSRLFWRTEETRDYINFINENYRNALAEGDYEAYSPTSFQFWRGSIILELNLANAGSVYLRMDNPIQIEGEDGDYWSAYNPLNNGWVNTNYTRISDGEEFYARSFEQQEYWSFEGDDDSGQMAQSTPLSIDNEGIEMHDNFAESFRDEVSYIRPTMKIYKTYEAATEGLDRQIDTSGGSFPDSAFEDFERAHSR